MDIRKWMKMWLSRLAELMAINGGTMVIDGRVGQPWQAGPEHNRYGRLGLTIQEAFELTYLRGAFDALAVGADLAALKAEIDREIRGELIEIPTLEMRERLLSGKTN